MTKKTLRTETAKSKVDMTPMLDIVFILLIFFIVTTSFIKEQGLLVKRPEMNKAASDTSPAMVLKISDTGLVFLMVAQLISSVYLHALKTLSLKMTVIRLLSYPITIPDMRLWLRLLIKSKHSAI